MEGYEATDGWRRVKLTHRGLCGVDASKAKQAMFVGMDTRTNKAGDVGSDA